MNDLLGLAILLKILHQDENVGFSYNNKELRKKTFVYSLLSLLLCAVFYLWIGYFQNVFLDLAIAAITGYFCMSFLALLYISIRSTIAIFISRY